jgi:hypothetical protein
VLGATFLLVVAGLGCEADPLGRSATPPRETSGFAAAPKPDDEPKKDPPKAVRKSFGKNVSFERIAEGDRRRVLIDAYVCLREGQLEQLMCRKQTKEHEAILAADVDARLIHAALIAAGAKTGATVQYKQKGDDVIVIPPSGSRIKVTLQYEEKGKLITVPAQKWVRDCKTKKDLAYDWVFAGSHLIFDPDDKDKPPFYAANAGDVITVANFEGAMLDLPINSSKQNAELAFEANTDRIPPLETKVTIILEPVPEAKKKD